MFELQPTLTGELIKLRPLKFEDYPGLYMAASDPLIWEQHPNSDRYKEAVFKGYFEGALECGGALIIQDALTDEIIGSSRYYGLDETASEVEIGWTFLTTNYWGGTYNRELKNLMLSHAYKYVDHVLFFVGPNNLRSRRAVEKLGATYIETRSRFGSDSVVYRLSKSEFAALKPETTMPTN
ncbi:MAG TPA: N-acetyltransferase [Candidatus Melainabacteria bacterium]|jgi:N-acetyltransferase|nr:N-acetyltransferase [Candidatus Melainabacteria bacterium]HIN67572.1 N-acetyltransferase [Candidatus Obscuribacterales bacterium]